MNENEISVGSVVWFLLSSSPFLRYHHLKGGQGGETHIELMPLMINSACRLLWFSFLKVKTHPNKDHVAKIMFLYFQPITSLNLKADSEMTLVSLNG